MKTKVFLFQLSYSELPEGTAFQRGPMVIRARFVFSLLWKTVANELHVTITAFLPLPQLRVNPKIYCKKVQMAAIFKIFKLNRSST